MKLLFITLCIIFSTRSVACYSPPEIQSTSVNNLIQRTKTIVLAHVAEAKYKKIDHQVEYTFKLVKIIKGQITEHIKLDGYPLIWEGGLNTFNNHTESVFWDTGRGRLVHSTDCLIHPSFSVGATYLLFLDRPYHNKSFEQIIRTHGDKGTKDKWLQYVETQTILTTK